MSGVPIESLELRQLCGYIATVTWVIIIWEGIVSFDDEIRYIWPMPWSAPVKWLYVLGKYLALVMQTVVFVLQVGYFADHRISLYHCHVYRLIEMVFSTILMLVFDAVLLLRIYALYGFYTWSSAIGTFAVIIEFFTTIISSSWTIPMTLYDTGCVMIAISKVILVFVVGTLAAQSTLLWLAYRKRDQAIRSRSSIACVTIRDGFMVFAGIAVFLVLCFYWTVHNSPITTLMIFWIPIFTSVATTRIILNLQRTRYHEQTQQFTTEIWGLYGSADSFLLSDGPFNRRGV